MKRGYYGFLLQDSTLNAAVAPRFHLLTNPKEERLKLCKISGVDSQYGYVIGDELSSGFKIFIPGSRTSLPMLCIANGKELLGIVIHVNCIENHGSKKHEYPFVALSMHPIEECCFHHDLIAEVDNFITDSEMKSVKKPKNDGFVQKEARRTSDLPPVVGKHNNEIRSLSRATLRDNWKFDLFTDIHSCGFDHDPNGYSHPIAEDLEEYVKLPENNSNTDTIQAQLIGDDDNDDEFVKPNFGFDDPIGDGSNNTTSVHDLCYGGLNVGPLEGHGLLNTSNNYYSDYTMQYPVPTKITDAAQHALLMTSDDTIESAVLESVMARATNQTAKLLSFRDGFPCEMTTSIPAVADQSVDRPPGNLDFGLAFN